MNGNMFGKFAFNLVYLQLTWYIVYQDDTIVHITTEE